MLILLSIIFYFNAHAMDRSAFKEFPDPYSAVQGAYGTFSLGFPESFISKIKNSKLEKENPEHAYYEGRLSQMLCFPELEFFKDEIKTAKEGTYLYFVDKHVKLFWSQIGESPETFDAFYKKHCKFEKSKYYSSEKLEQFGDSYHSFIKFKDDVKLILPMGMWAESIMTPKGKSLILWTTDNNILDLWGAKIKVEKESAHGMRALFITDLSNSKTWLLGTGHIEKQPDTLAQPKFSPNQKYFLLKSQDEKSKLAFKLFDTDELKLIDSFTADWPKKSDNYNWTISECFFPYHVSDDAKLIVYNFSCPHECGQFYKFSRIDRKQEQLWKLEKINDTENSCEGRLTVDPELNYGLESFVAGPNSSEKNFVFRCKMYLVDLKSKRRTPLMTLTLDYGIQHYWDLVLPTCLDGEFLEGSKIKFGVAPDIRVKNQPKIFPEKKTLSIKQALELKEPISDAWKQY